MRCILSSSFSSLKSCSYPSNSIPLPPFSSFQITSCSRIPINSCQELLYIDVKYKTFKTLPCHFSEWRNLSGSYPFLASSRWGSHTLTPLCWKPEHPFSRGCHNLFQLFSRIWSLPHYSQTLSYSCACSLLYSLKTFWATQDQKMGIQRT